MGNQVIRGAVSGTGSHKKPMITSGGDPTTTTKKAMSRSASGADIEHTSHTQLLPIDKLAKILTDRSQREESVNGVTGNVFRRYVFPQYPEFADKLFALLHRQSKATTNHLGIAAFKQQAEKFLSIMNDQIILESYVRMYSRENADVTPEGLNDLLMVTYQLALDSSAGRPQRCPLLHRTIDSVTTSCFHGKEVLSISYVSNWLWQHCPRLLNGLHRYVVHVFTTAYRNGPNLLSEAHAQPQLEPATPVLEQSSPFDGSKPLLPLSHVWLLSGSLPPCYTQTVASSAEGTQALIAKMAGATYPSHWTLLYNSGQHGSGANPRLRFTE